jgi:hypothetical protein
MHTSLKMHNNGIVRRFVSIYLESRATPGNSASEIIKIKEKLLHGTSITLTKSKFFYKTLCHRNSYQFSSAKD